MNFKIKLTVFTHPEHLIYCLLQRNAITCAIKLDKESMFGCNILCDNFSFQAVHTFNKHSQFSSATACFCFHCEHSKYIILKHIVMVIFNISTIQYWLINGGIIVNFSNFLCLQQKFIMFQNKFKVLFIKMQL